MNGNKMLLHCYSAAFHAPLLSVAKEVCKHVTSATSVIDE